MAWPADPHRRDVSARNSGVEPGVGQRLAAKLAPMPISDPDWALVSCAIEDALAATNFAMSTALNPAQETLVFANAGGLLMRRAARADLALALAESAIGLKRDTMHLRGMRLEAMARLVPQDQLIAEINRLADWARQDIGQKPILQRCFIRMSRDKRLPSIAATHDVLWGDSAGDIFGILGSASLRSGPEITTRALRDLLIGISALPVSDPVDFGRRIDWGRRAVAYFRFLSGAILLQTLDPDQSIAPGAARMKALFDQSKSLQTGGDLTELRQARDAGHSIIVMQSHSGPSFYLKGAFEALNMPSSFVHQIRLPNEAPGDFNICTSDLATLPLEFVKLAKLIKSEPRLVRIFPDGGQGDDATTISVCGCSIKIGAGAATLAHLGRSALFFAASRWRDGKIELDITRGPVIGATMNREETGQVVAKFYAEGLQRVLQGPPEDFGMSGGFWADLIRSQAPGV